MVTGQGSELWKRRGECGIKLCYFKQAGNLLLKFHQTKNFTSSKKFYRKYSEGYTLDSKTTFPQLETFEKRKTEEKSFSKFWKKNRLRSLVSRIVPQTKKSPVCSNKPGTAQVGAISKAQKDSKTTFSTTGDNKSSQKTKN